MSDFRPRERGKISRFKARHQGDASEYLSLADDHPAIVGQRTLFPKTVVNAVDSPRLLVSGKNNPKLGDHITKGPRAGWPIYHLTLEERATCSSSCAMWTSCYGNSMHMARRHRIDEHFYALLSAELTILAREHRAGFLVRLHTLGDFPSVEYVKFWADMLEKIPQLHVFGFTARNENDPDPETRRIAQAIAFVANQVWDSFSIRFSTPTAVPQGATVYEKAVKSPEVIMCPAQIQATTACATCGLCWADATRFKTIGFLRHGMKKPTGNRGPRAPKESGDAQPVGRPPMDTEELAAATRKVLAVLRRAADPDGISTISITDISRESGHTPTRVRNCLDLLLSDKVISAEHRGHGAFPSTYELDLKAADQALTTATPRQDPERQMPDWLAASRARLAQFDSSLK